MEQLHRVYQALKSTTDKLYTEVEQDYLSDVRGSLDSALKALEDKLGITKAARDGLRRKKREDTPVNEVANPGAPTVITVAPGDRRAPGTK